jgi:hypothetical protein
MKIVKWLALSLAGVVALLAAVVATRPAAFRIERSISIAAPAPAIQVHVLDLKAWRAWSPWEQVDPDMARSYEGAAAGVGARYDWRGNSDIGSGRMTITEATPEKVAIRLEFLEPMAATNVATFAFAPEGAGTRVTWAMDGTNGFMGKAVSLLLDMDQMIGAQFETGLAALKTVAEKGA